MKVFRVLKPGFFTTVQDFGRYGYLKYGIPISGAMDTFSLVAANALVANNKNGACLEIALIGPELQALTEIQITITGGDASPKISSQEVPMWRTLEVERDDVISFGKFESGCRAYLSIRGGINTPIVLGSRSTYTRGGFGGIDGRQLRSGDIIEGFDAPLLEHVYSMPDKLIPEYTRHFDVPVVAGPQADWFTDEGKDAFLLGEYTVTLESDRIGYRLAGLQIEWKKKSETISDALLPGAVQIPRNGNPIILMRDAQTTGGYPKIAVATTDAVSMLGQAKPNDTLKFHSITPQQAHKKIIEYYTLLNSLREMLIKN